MSDKNYKSYEYLIRKTVEGVSLEPENPTEYDDIMKVYRCRDCRFLDFVVEGGKEDCVDLGKESYGNEFRRMKLMPNGRYVFTIKGGSHMNYFKEIEIVGHGNDVDIEIGNWSTSNFDHSKGNVFNGIWSRDDSLVTYCYRWGCKPTFINSDVKHLWWRSIGLTFYWWFKYVWHVILKRRDNMGK